jgi:hypothetical protein
MDQARIEVELNLLLLKIAEIQKSVDEGVEVLREEGKLPGELEGIVEKVMREVDSWTDQCTAPAETPPILLRRMQVQMERLARIERLIEDLRR